MAVNEAVNIQADGAPALLGEGPEQQAEGGQDDDQAQIRFIGLGSGADREANGRGHDQGIHRAGSNQQRGTVTSRPSSQPQIGSRHTGAQRLPEQQYRNQQMGGRQSTSSQPQFGNRKRRAHMADDAGDIAGTRATSATAPCRWIARQSPSPSILLLYVAAGDRRDNRADIAGGIHQ